MLKPISNGPIPPASPAKQLILRLAAELARLHDSQPSTLDLIDEARTYLAQPEPEGPTDEELLAAQDQAVASFPPIHPELSPAAQAVLDAYWKSPWDPSLQHEDRYAIAAALEALADQVVPENYYAVNLYEDSGWVNGLEARNEEVRSELLAIAAELKANA